MISSPSPRSGLVRTHSASPCSGETTSKPRSPPSIAARQASRARFRTARAARADAPADQLGGRHRTGRERLARRELQRQLAIDEQHRGARQPMHERAVAAFAAGQRALVCAQLRHVAAGGVDRALVDDRAQRPLDPAPRAVAVAPLRRHVRSGIAVDPTRARRAPEQRVIFGSDELGDAAAEQLGLRPAERLAPLVVDAPQAPVEADRAEQSPDRSKKRVLSACSRRCSVTSRAMPSAPIVVPVASRNGLFVTDRMQREGPKRPVIS